MANARYYYRLDKWYGTHDRGEKERYDHPILTVYAISGAYKEWYDESRTGRQKDGRLNIGNELFSIRAQANKHDDARCCGHTYGCEVKIEATGYHLIEQALAAIKQIITTEQKDNLLADTMRWLRKKNATRIARENKTYSDIPYQYRKNSQAYLDAVKAGLIKKVA